MRSINDIGNIDGKKIFIRTDFNVPIKDGKVFNDLRIKKTLPTIDFLLNKGGQIILASHIEEKIGTLKPVFEYLSNKYDLTFIEDYYPQSPKSLSDLLSKKKIVLLENLRKYPQELENSIDFAKHLAGFADIYVNEAFSVSHRRHASIVSVPKFLPSFSGLELSEEIRQLSRAFHPPHPFLFVLAGAKFETKLPLLKKFFALADNIFIGGALANDFLKAQGHSVGKSLFSKNVPDLKAFLTKKLILPSDVVVRNQAGIFSKKIEEILPEDYIVDVGERAITALDEIIETSNFILWNGPLGNYEENFKQATLSLAKKIAENPNYKIIGGGDTAASIAELGLEDKFSFISTGGGAMLEFLANETLPGIEILNSNR